MGRHGCGGKTAVCRASAGRQAGCGRSCRPARRLAVQPARHAIRLGPAVRRIDRAGCAARAACRSAWAARRHRAHVCARGSRRPGGRCADVRRLVLDLRWLGNAPCIAGGNKRKNRAPRGARFRIAGVGSGNFQRGTCCFAELLWEDTSGATACRDYESRPRAQQSCWPHVCHAVSQVANCAVAAVLQR